MLQWVAGHGLDVLADFLGARVLKAIGKIRDSFRKRAPLIQLMLQDDQGWWIVYQVPREELEEALKAIPTDFFAEPITNLRDNRFWEGGRWLSAHKHLVARDPSYGEYFKRLVASRSKKNVKASAKKSTGRGPRRRKR